MHCTMNSGTHGHMFLMIIQTRIALIADDTAGLESRWWHHRQSRRVGISGFQPGPTAGHDSSDIPHHHICATEALPAPRIRGHMTVGMHAGRQAVSAMWSKACFSLACTMRAWPAPKSAILDLSGLSKSSPPFRRLCQATPEIMVTT